MAAASARNTVRKAVFRRGNHSGFSRSTVSTADFAQRTALSIVIAIVLGLALGVLISEFQRSSKPVMGLVNFVYTIPSISLLGFLIPFSGIGDTTAVIALTVYALLPMVRNTYAGLTNVNPLLVEAAAGMGSTKFEVLYKSKIPLA